MSEKIHDLLTSPTFIFILIVLIIFVVIGIIYSNLSNIKKKLGHLINENRDYLENRIPILNQVLDSLISQNITNQEVVDELNKVKQEINVLSNDINGLIRANNVMYKFINSPILKTEEYQTIDTTLTNTYNEGRTDVLMNERKNYNELAFSYNSKLSDFPTSLIAKIGNFKALQLFEDVIEKTTNDINNSASYLSNNYNINQETIKSPEAKTEEQTSNLFIANKNKPIENQVVIEKKEDVVTPANTMAPVQQVPTHQPEAPTNVVENNSNASNQPNVVETNLKETVTVETEPSAEAQATPAENNIIEPNNIENQGNGPELVSEPTPEVATTDNQPLPETPKPDNAAESVEVSSPVAESIAEEPSVETQTQQPEIEIANPINNTILEPISINESQESTEASPIVAPSVEPTNETPNQVIDLSGGEGESNLNQSSPSAPAIELNLPEVGQSQTEETPSPTVIDLTIPPQEPTPNQTDSEQPNEETQTQDIQTTNKESALEDEARVVDAGNQHTIEVTSSHEPEPTITEIVKTEEKQEITSKSEEEVKRFCPNCNKLTNERFCPECGYPTE